MAAQATTGTKRTRPQANDKGKSAGQGESAGRDETRTRSDPGRRVVTPQERKGEPRAESKPETSQAFKADQAHADMVGYPIPLQAEGIASRLRRWFEQEGLLDRELTSAGYNFHFKVVFNHKAYQCFQPEQAPDKTVLFTRTKVTPDHRSALSVIEAHERDELYLQLNFVFVDKAAFALKKDELGVLYEFQLSRVIYADGLTKHQLMSDLRTLHAANLAGSWHLQRLLGPGGDTFGSKEQEEVLRPEMYR